MCFGLSTFKLKKLNSKKKLRKQRIWNSIPNQTNPHVMCFKERESEKKAMPGQDDVDVDDDNYQVKVQHDGQVRKALKPSIRSERVK